MSDNRDKKLLQAFCVYCDTRQGHEDLDDADLIDAFLAARQPQDRHDAEMLKLAEEIVAQGPSTEPVEQWAKRLAGELVEDACAYDAACHGAPPAPQRFWRVCEVISDMDGKTVEYRVYVVTAQGAVAMPFAPFDHRPTRELAADDGRASKLPEWKPATEE